jgi:hypothetical protein
MSFFVFKVGGDDIIINSDKIVAVTIETSTKKPLIHAGTHLFPVDESMDEVKKILHAKTFGKKGPGLKSLVGHV